MYTSYGTANCSGNTTVNATVNFTECNKWGEADNWVMITKNGTAPNNSTPSNNDTGAYAIKSAMLAAAVAFTASQF